MIGERTQSRSVASMNDREVWVFGYGSLIWYRSGIKPIEAVLLNYLLSNLIIGTILHLGKKRK